MEILILHNYLQTNMIKTKVKISTVIKKKSKSARINVPMYIYFDDYPPYTDAIFII